MRPTWQCMGRGEELQLHEVLLPNQPLTPKRGAQCSPGNHRGFGDHCHQDGHVDHACQGG